MGAPSRRWAVILLAVLSSLPAAAELSGCRAGDPVASVHSGPWGGIYPTVVTPFCDAGVDVAALEQQIRFQLRGGVHGLLVLGTIGEGQYVTPLERAQVIASAVHVCGAHVPVVVGIHTCDLDVARLEQLQAQQLGAAAVLVKYLGNPRACGDEVLAFYAGLTEMHALPIFYYHYPDQTGLKLSPADIAAILRLPGVVGIKELIVDLKEVRAHLRLTCGLGKVFFSCTALNLTQFMDLGGHGAMSPEPVLLPGPVVQAYNAWVHGRHAEARSIQKELFVLTPILKANSPPVPVTRAIFMCAEDCKLPLSVKFEEPQARIKAALNCLGVPTPTTVKFPLPPLTEKDQRHVDKGVCRLKQIDWGEGRGAVEGSHDPPGRRN